MKRAVVALIVLLGLGLIAAPAVAQTLDPQLFICNGCSTPPGGDPNPITNPGNFTVGVAGSDTMNNPLLIVIANYDSTAQPTVSFGSTPSEPLATVGTYGLTTNHFATFNGGGTVFSNLGLAAGGSLSFGNLSAGDTKNGIAAPSFFSLWAFAVPINLAGAASGFDTNAGVGSFINAYSCINGTASGTPPGPCATPGDRGQSVNTNQGLVTKVVPEPASMALLGTVLLGAYGLIRRKLSPETES